MSLLEELRRRNVFRVGAAYVVLAWLVIQVVETIFPAFGFGDAAIRISTIVFAIGLVPTLIFAWAFELTPEGLKKESEVDRTRSIAPQTGKKLDRMIMVVLALALGYFAFDKFVLSKSREATRVEQARQEGRTEALVESYGDKSIAVLAFDDMSPEGDQEYLSDGIAEELLNLLARIPDLRVISRSSAFSFKDKDLEIPEIAERLNVAHILEGSVRKSGNQVRITAQLIDARSDTHLWSNTYDRQLDDIFAIQDEIAASVVDQLKITLLGDVPHVEKTNPEAYALVLQARYLTRRTTAEGWEQAADLYQKSLAIDPDFAPAWIGLADVYSSQADRALLDMDEGYQKAREAVRKALESDPDYARAHSMLGWIAMYHDHDLGAAAGHYEKALALDPSDVKSIGLAAVLLHNLGRMQEAIAFFEYARARDPVDVSMHANLGRSYLRVRRWDDAIASLETALRLNPGAYNYHYSLGTAYLYKGEYEAALEAMQRETFEGYRLIGLAMVYHAMGRSEESDAALAELIEKYERGGAYNIAYVYAYRGEADSAFAWLEKAVEYGDSGLGEIATQTHFESLYDDPRWLTFLESIGKSPEQLAAIEFDVTLP